MSNSKILVRDICYNLKNCRKLASRLIQSYDQFDEKKFVNQIKENLYTLTLKEREVFIKNLLEELLPKNFKKLNEIILSAQLPELPKNFQDDNYGDFISVPQAQLIAEKGCHPNYFNQSLLSLKEMTKRFSCEFAIRKLLLYDAKQVFNTLKDWTKSDNCHVRRLCSEGIRSRLPWRKGVTYLKENPKKIISILKELHNDPYRFVTRSVANNLNDLSKDHPDLVIKTLQKWQESTESCKEFEWLKKHSLRTLIKKGHRPTLNFLGYSSHVRLINTKLNLKPKKIEVPDYLNFDFSFATKKESMLMIDYRIGFLKSNQQINQKVFKIKTLQSKSNQKITLKKKHLFKLMATKKLYSGIHTLEIQINGKIVLNDTFELII